MDYEVRITETVQKEIKKKLDAHLIDRLDTRIKKLEDNPKSFGKPLRGELAGKWEIYFERRYRIIYEIYENAYVVEIVGFKHKDEM